MITEPVQWWVIGLGLFLLVILIATLIGGVVKRSAEPEPEVYKPELYKPVPRGPTLMEKIENRLSGIEDHLGIVKKEPLEGPLTGFVSISQIISYLSNIQKSLGVFQKGGKSIMTLLQDLTNLVVTLTADVAKEADEVSVAVDALKAAVAALDAAKNDPAVKAAVDALTASHAALTATTAKLKAGVDAVSASGTLK